MTPTTVPPPNRMLTYDQAADLMQVSRRTVERWVKENKLPHFRIDRVVRIRLDDIERHIQKNSDQA